MNRTIRVATALVAGTLLALAVPLAASAHVTLDTNTAEANSFTLLTFKVPNESETAGTSKIEVTLPLDTPLAFVSYVPVPGWTTEVVTEHLDTPVEGLYGEITDPVSKVVWTANPGSEVLAGQLQLFPLSVGPVPDTGSIVLPVEQTYTDGTVVSWSETGEDAEHPAPVLFINDAPVTDEHDGDTVVSATQVSANSTESPDVLARILGVGGLVVGVIGLVFGITARRKAA